MKTARTFGGCCHACDGLCPKNAGTAHPAFLKTGTARMFFRERQRMEVAEKPLSLNKEIVENYKKYSLN
jgi:hypothetical protein